MRSGPKALIAGTMVGATVFGIWALTRKAKAEPEPEPEPPPPGFATLYGKVTDADTGRPIAGVSARVPEADVETLSDDSGFYFLGLEAPQGWTVTFEKSGYEPMTFQLYLYEGIREFNVVLAVVEVPPVPILPFTFSNVSVRKVTMYDAPAWETMEFYCTISNPNDLTLTKLIKVMCRWGTGSAYKQWSFELTLAPGQSYNFKWDGNRYGQRNPDAYNGPLVARRQRVCMWLEDEEGNKSQEGCVTGSG